MKTALAAAAFTLGLLLAMPRPAAAQGSADARQQTEGTIEPLRKAIINQDTASVMRLFLREDISPQHRQSI